MISQRVRSGWRRFWRSEEIGAFIEPLLEYDERERRLKGGNAERLVTAVMVGGLAKDVQTAEQGEKFLPQDLLVLLSLAAGIEAGAPWIELREEQGELVTRLQTHRSMAFFSQGHRAIDEAIHDGIGRLFTRGTRARTFGSPTFRIPAKHLARGGQRRLTIGDRLRHSLSCIGKSLQEPEDPCSHLSS